NDITDEGKEYIYSILGDPDASIEALNGMELRDANNDPDTDALVDNNNNNTPVPVASASITCTPSASPTEATCVGTFDFEPDYTPTSAGSLVLDTGKKIAVGHLVGNTFTPYFELTSIDPITLSANTTYATLEITWTITVS
ncbi:MAG: hypothetical protein QXN32_04945, partial [Candidatus Nitrosocaldus sp.]